MNITKGDKVMERQARLLYAKMKKQPKADALQRIENGRLSATKRKGSAIKEILAEEILYEQNKKKHETSPTFKCHYISEDCIDKDFSSDNCHGKKTNIQVNPNSIPDADGEKKSSNADLVHNNYKLKGDIHDTYEKKKEDSTPEGSITNFDKTEKLQTITCKLYLKGGNAAGIDEFSKESFLQNFESLNYGKLISSCYSGGSNAYIWTLFFVCCLTWFSMSCSFYVTAYFYTEPLYECYSNSENKFLRCNEMDYCKDRELNRITYAFASFIQKYDLICGQRHDLRLHYQNFYIFVESFVSMIFVALADVYGRKIWLCVGQGLNLIGFFMILVSSSFVFVNLGYAIASCGTNIAFTVAIYQLMESLCIFF